MIGGRAVEASPLRTDAGVRIAFDFRRSSGRRQGGDEAGYYAGLAYVRGVAADERCWM